VQEGDGEGGQPHLEASNLRQRTGVFKQQHHPFQDGGERVTRDAATVKDRQVDLLLHRVPPRLEAASNPPSMVLLVLLAP
jgi:hypothetical protein